MIQAPAPSGVRWCPGIAARCLRQCLGPAADTPARTESSARLEQGLPPRLWLLAAPATGGSGCSCGCGCDSGSSYPPAPAPAPPAGRGPELLAPPLLPQPEPHPESWAEPPAPPPEHGGCLAPPPRQPFSAPPGSALHSLHRLTPPPLGLVVSLSVPLHPTRRRSGPSPPRAKASPQRSNEGGKQWGIFPRA